jgi:hypothetical protein
MSTSPFSPREIRAAAETHHELGPEYHDAVVASFIDKIDREIAARVDERVAGTSSRAEPARPPRAEPATLGHRHTLLLGVAIGTAVSGVPLIMIASSGGATLAKDGLSFLVVLWVVLAAVWAVVAVRGRRPPDDRGTR